MTAVWVLLAVAYLTWLGRHRITAWLVDRFGLGPPPEVCDLDDDERAAFLEIVAHYGRTPR